MRRMDMLGVAGSRFSKIFYLPEPAVSSSLAPNDHKPRLIPEVRRVPKNRPPMISFLVMALCAQACPGPELPSKTVKPQEVFEFAKS